MGYDGLLWLKEIGLTVENQAWSMETVTNWYSRPNDFRHTSEQLPNNFHQLTISFQFDFHLVFGECSSIIHLPATSVAVGHFIGRHFSTVRIDELPCAARAPRCVELFFFFFFDVQESFAKNQPQVMRFLKGFQKRFFWVQRLFGILLAYVPRFGSDVAEY